jgi:hypothetical protein
MSIVELVPITDDETNAEIVRLCKDGVSVARATAPTRRPEITAIGGIG